MISKDQVSCRSRVSSKEEKKQKRKEERAIMSGTNTQREVWWGIVADCGQLRTKSKSYSTYAPHFFTPPFPPRDGGLWAGRWMAKFTSPELSLRFPFTALHCTPHGYPPTLGHNALLSQPLQGGKIASLSSTSVYQRQDTEQKTGKEKGERTSVR